MKKFKVAVEETSINYYTVKAKNEDKAKELYSIMNSPHNIIPKCEEILSVEEIRSDNSPKEIKPEYDRDECIRIVEMYFDEWSQDDDWWFGTGTYDINVYTPEDGEVHIIVYPLEWDEDRYKSVNTGYKLDQFSITIKGETK